MPIELEEFEPNRWRVKRPELRPVRSDNLPLPYVISDNMEPTEQVDGRFYTSKRAFRATGRALGLIEIGTEKLKPKTARASETREAADKRRTSIKRALEQVRSG